MAEFVQHPVYSNYYVSKDGSYYFIKANGQKSDVKLGTPVRNKYGKSIMREQCITTQKGIYTVVNVGRLVLETFVSLAPGNDYEVDHINADPLDNRLENLRWVTHEQNLANRKSLIGQKWTTDRHAKRLETAKKLGYNTWGELLNAGKAKKWAEKHNIKLTQK